MRVLVTRPEPDDERTAAKLRARGCEVMLAPLLRVEAVDAALDGAWDVVALTSVNAVRAIASHPKRNALFAMPAYAVGGRTADAAMAEGFANVVSADGDVGDLVRVIKTHLRAHARVLHLVGEDRSGDLAGELAAGSLDVETVVVYRAVAAAELPREVRAALAAGNVDGVVHFSRRTADTYLACAKAAGITREALAPAQYCLSQQVAAPLVAAGAGTVRIAERSTEAALLNLVNP
jgi:uroporphyrinogen-III synthase